MNLRWGRSSSFIRVTVESFHQNIIEKMKWVYSSKIWVREKNVCIMFQTEVFTLENLLLPPSNSFYISFTRYISLFQWLEYCLLLNFCGSCFSYCKVRRLCQSCLWLILSICSARVFINKILVHIKDIHLAEERKREILGCFIPITWSCWFWIGCAFKIFLWVGRQLH